MTFQLPTSQGFTNIPSGPMSRLHGDSGLKLVKKGITKIIDDANRANWDVTDMTATYDNTTAPKNVLSADGTAHAIYGYCTDTQTKYMERTFDSNVAIDPDEPLCIVMNWLSLPGSLAADGIRVHLYHDSSNYNLSSSWYFSNLQTTPDWTVYKVIPSSVSHSTQGEKGLDPEKTGWVNGSGGPFVPASGIKRIRLEYVDQRSSYGPIYIGCYQGSGHTSAIVLYFDDGGDSIFDAVYDYSSGDFSDSWGSISLVDRMRNWGLVGTCGLIRDNVAGSNKLTAAEIKLLHSYGWDMGVHGTTQIPVGNTFTTLDKAFNDTPAGEGDSVLYNRGWHISQGLTGPASWQYAYPTNNYRGEGNQDTLIARMKLEGFETARTSWPQLATTIDPNLGAGYLPEWYALAGAGIESPTGLWETQTELFDAIDNFIIPAGVTFMPYLHTIYEGDNTSSIGAAPRGSSSYYRDDAARLINKIGTDVQNGDLVCLTASEWYRNMNALTMGG